jgi:acyl carrier protein
VWLRHGTGVRSAEVRLSQRLACYRARPLSGEGPVNLQAAIESEIRTFLSKNFPLSASGTVDAEQSLVESGVIDSLGVLELVEFVEDKYDFRIPEGELLPENLDSIGNITRFVAKKLGARDAAGSELDRT